MCEACKQEVVASGKERRRKLWEIESNWHCMIVGTCVSMSELRRLAARLGMPAGPEPASDHDIHSTMVYWASRNRRVGKAIHKLLERKYAPAAFRFAKIDNVEELAQAWRAAVERGEVAGALWALMSHPAASSDLQTMVFGEVHMLSHQLGAASRADLRRIHVLEKEKAALEDKVARQQDRLRDEVSGRERTIRELREQLDTERAELRRLAHAAAGAAELDGLRAFVAELQRHVSIAEAGRRSAEEKLRAVDARLTDGEAAIRSLQAEADDLRGENASLEAQLVAAMGDGRVAACDRSCGRPDLCGRCILYVGRRAGHLPHLRRIVEECNGTLVHHDGGLEENMGRLNGLLGQADAVMFPVDCISHMAHDQLKRLCKRWEKPFVPIPRSGLGAFLRALETVRPAPQAACGGG